MYQQLCCSEEQFSGADQQIAGLYQQLSLLEEQFGSGECPDGYWNAGIFASTNQKSYICSKSLMSLF